MTIPEWIHGVRHFMSQMMRPIVNILLRIKNNSPRKERLATVAGFVLLTMMLVFAANDSQNIMNGVIGLNKQPVRPSLSTSNTTNEAIVVTDKAIEVNYKLGVSLYQAVYDIASKAGMAVSFDYAGTNTVALLRTRETMYDNIARPMAWRIILNEILKSAHCGFTENGTIQIMPLDRYHEMERQRANDALRQNHTQIELAIKDVPARVALETVAENANLTMNFNYLPAPDATNQAVRLVSFKTSSRTEWRAVLNNILDPCGLDFIEEDGAVKPMTKALAIEKRLQQEQAKPLMRKIFPIKHANVSDMITQLRAMNILSPRGTLTPSQSENQNTKSVSADLGGSGSGSSGSGSGSFGSGSGSSGGSMEYPRIIPAIIANDTEESINRLTEMIDRLDMRERQIAIEARIIDVRDTDGKTLGILWDTLGFFGAGINWTMTDNKGVNKNKTTSTSDNKSRSLDEYASETRDNVNGGREIVDTTTDKSGRTRTLDDNYARTVSDAYNETRTAILGPLDLSLTIDALKTLGNAEMVSHPILVVGNRSEAVIHVGENYPTWTVTAQQAGGTIASSNIQYTYTDALNVLDLGLNLWVLPEITGDGKQIRLSITPAMVDFVEEKSSKNGSTYPLTSTRSITTRVTVPSRKTLLLGGLVGVKNKTIEKRVPFLGDIPILGYLFRHDVDSQEKSNLIILLTPTILDEETPATGFEDFNLAKSDSLEDGGSFLRAATNAVPVATNMMPVATNAGIASISIISP